MLNCKKTIWSKNYFGQYSARHFWLSSPHFWDFVRIKWKIATYNIKLSTTCFDHFFRLRLLAKCHSLKLTFKNFTGLSILQICLQNLQTNLRVPATFLGASLNFFLPQQAYNYLSMLANKLFWSCLSNFGVKWPG